MRILSVLLMGFSAAVLAHAPSDNGIKPVEISDAYVRAMPPGQANTAGFLTIHNPNAKVFEVKSIHSKAAKTVELHQHSMNDGMMQMREMKNFSIAAGDTVEFKPGGMHIMFMGITEPLKEGDEISFEFCFSDFCQPVTLPVRGIGYEPSSQHKHH
jgi:hypothetical protein